MWNYSAMNYDMINASPWNCMNLHMNQLYDHSLAMTSLYMFPQYDFSNFYQYGNSYANNWMTNPMYTVGQMTWGTPAWNQVANTFGWSGMGFGGAGGIGGGGGSSNGTTKEDDPEQDAFRIKYNKLYNLVNLLRKNSENIDFTDDEIATLNAACKNAKGTWEEKYTTLKEAYDKVKEDAREQIKDFLIETEQVRIETNRDGKQKSNSDSFGKALAEAGFKMDDPDYDLVEEYYDSIAKIKENDASAELASGITALCNPEEIGSESILKFISNWNTRYKDDPDSKRILKYIKKHVETLDKETLRETPCKHIIDPLIDALINKSETYSSKVLDADSYKKLEDARKKLREEQENCNDTITSGVEDAFDTLYVLTRKAAMAEIRYNAIQSYGSIDDDIFNENLFVDEVNNDLIEEGFNVANTEMTVRSRRNDGRNNKSSNSSETRTEASESSNENVNVNSKAQNPKQAKADGKYVAENLPGYTEDYMITEINNKLSTINKTNVIDFLEGYYVDGGRAKDIEGLIERLDDENDSGTIKMQNKKQLIQSVLDVAKDKGLEDSDNYKKIDEIINVKYENDSDLKEKNTFNHSLWSNFFANGEFRYDNGRIDKHLKALYDEIKKEADTQGA